MDGSGIDCVLHGEQEGEGEGGGNNKCIRPSRKTMTTPSSILHFSKCQDENFMMREGRRPSVRVRVRPARWPQQLEVAPFRHTMGGQTAEDSPLQWPELFIALQNHKRASLETPF